MFNSIKPKYNLHVVYAAVAKPGTITELNLEKGVYMHCTCLKAYAARVSVGNTLLCSLHAATSPILKCCPVCVCAFVCVLKDDLSGLAPVGVQAICSCWYEQSHEADEALFLSLRLQISHFSLSNRNPLHHGAKTWLCRSLSKGHAFKTHCGNRGIPEPVSARPCPNSDRTCEVCVCVGESCTVRRCMMHTVLDTSKI